MKEAEITRREELNDRETEEIASVLEGARPSNRIDVDRKELRDRLNHMLTKTGLIHSPEGDDGDPAFEEAFAEYASEPESARKLRDQYWHEKNWAEVIDGVIASLPSAQVVLCGVSVEMEMCQAILRLCQAPENVQAVADDLPLRRLLALLSLAHSCISVDTGPAHAAAAMNCPLVVLFGKASPNRFRPVSSNSPVRVITGHAEGRSDSEPDIGYITPQQVLTEWMKDNR